MATSKPFYKTSEAWWNAIMGAFGAYASMKPENPWVQIAGIFLMGLSGKNYTDARTTLKTNGSTPPVAPSASP